MKSLHTRKILLVPAGGELYALLSPAVPKSIPISRQPLNIFIVFNLGTLGANSDVIIILFCISLTTSGVSLLSHVCPFVSGSLYCLTTYPSPL